ncbi:uncharacterized protein LOC118415495 [Branchiostoma floridae]|uniref:Uncharacterized protein LOC118415495 n=1 Tax=Branchiostoma floridae TaxID=7739 RepID=A0A9J7L504_BRAFL|nr:uncharacterized protein LOC118415495 [Branchiostoma floridae]
MKSRIDNAAWLIANKSELLNSLARRRLPTIKPATLTTTTTATTLPVSTEKTNPVCRISSYSWFNGVCYKDFAQKRSYDVAMERCAADGGQLAMPKDSEINSFLNGLREGTDHRWFGMTDRLSEGQWVFEDGQHLALTGYSNWEPGEPNNKDRRQHCAGFRPTTPTWDDMRCVNTKGFMCQIDQGTHSLRIKTSGTKNSGTNNDLSVEILSDSCNGACLTATISGIKSKGTEYVRTMPASTFGDPSGLRLNALGNDNLKIDWIEIYNADAARYYRFSCPPESCRLSTDRREGNEQLLLEVDESHILRIRTSDIKESNSRNDLSVEILSDTCNGTCTGMTVSGLAVKGTVYVRTFSASNFGDPTALRLTATGPDWLELDWIDVYIAETGKYYRFSCRDIVGFYSPNGCELSTDRTEGFQQLLLHVDGQP